MPFISRHFTYGFPYRISALRPHVGGFVDSTLLSAQATYPDTNIEASALERASKSISESK